MSRLRRGRSALKEDVEEPAGSAADDAAQLRREEEEEQKRKSKAAAADTEEAPADEEDDDDASIPGPAAGRRGKRKARVAALGAEKKKAKGSGKKKGRAAAAAAAAVSDTEDLVALSVSSGPWSCGACTFSNGKDALACGVCGSPKPVGGGAASRSWKCGVCTMVNEPDRDKCAMCGSIKEATTAAAAGAGDDSQMMDLTGSSTAAAAGAAAPPSSSSKSKRNSNAAAASAPDPPKLTDNRVFLAGLEESLGSVHVSPYFKSRLAHTLKKQWLILDSKMAGVSPLQMPLEDLRECQKALVHSACLKALRAQRTLELLLNCGQFEIDQLAAAQCLHCATSGAAVNLLLTTKNCFHPICGPCGAKYIKESMGRRTCFQLTCPSSSCNLEITPGFVQRCLSKAEFSVYNDLCFELSTADPSKYQTCPIETCKALTEFIPPAPGAKELPLPKDGIKVTAEDGKILSPAAWRHYSTYRLRCRSCPSTDFCASCRVTPYHMGRTCEEHAEYQTSKHCRFCTEQLQPGKSEVLANGLAVCKSPTCQQMKKHACKHQLECGHACFGVAGETEHPPCIAEDCPSATEAVDGGENCAICYVEELRNFGPIVQLSGCKHAFHQQCVLEKIKKKWAGTRITFGFLDCSKCKQKMSHPSREIRAVLDPIVALMEDVEAKALARLKIEKMENDAKLVTEGSPFYNKPKDYAMASFAYYNCFKCKKFYFGGRRDCEQNAAAEVRPENEFVCYGCADLKSVACKNPDHSEFQLWKCRFCCNPAVWFCFGTTHFCDPCHVNAGATMAKRRDKTKQCPGPAKCPLKVAHAPNGPEADCEFNVGCGVCQEKVLKVLDERKKEEAVNEAVEAEAAAAAKSHKKK